MRKQLTKVVDAHGVSISQGIGGPVFDIGMRKVLFYLLVILGFAGCSKELPENQSSTPTAPLTEKFLGVDLLIATTNNGSNKIEVYDPDVTNWNSGGALEWSWMPTTGLGYTSAEVDKWVNGDPTGDPMDVKLRNSTVWSGSTQVVVAVGGEIATIARYTGGTRGQKLWARNVGAGQYPHAIELLPNGNVAVVATHGNWLRLFNTTGTNYYEVSLATPHGVVWDPSRNWLWVLAKEYLLAYTVGSSRTSPTLTEVRRKAISPNGHDLSAFFNDNDKLLITSTTGVYLYSKSANTISNLPGAAFRTSLKSISNQPSGMYVETKPDPDCTLNTWCTSTVEFYNGTTGAAQGSRTRSGASFYKADVFSADYLPTKTYVPAGHPIPNGRYKIIANHSGQAVVVQGASMDINANVIQWDYVGGTTPNDAWDFEAIPNGYYKISNANGGKYMVVQYASLASEAYIITHNYTADATSNDEWAVVSVGGGYYKLVVRYTGFTLNVEGGLSGNGKRLMQYLDVGGNNAKFQIIAIN